MSQYFFTSRAHPPTHQVDPGTGVCESEVLLCVTLSKKCQLFIPVPDLAAHSFERADLYSGKHNQEVCVPLPKLCLPVFA